MEKCTDADAGKLLHDYEMDWLSPEDQERFELHLMNCRYCFREVQRFKLAAILISKDDEIKAAFADSIHDTAKESKFWLKFLELFWPKTNLLLKPAVFYLVILIILPLAYTGLQYRLFNRGQVKPTQVVDLVTTRGSLQTIRPKPDYELILNFSYAEAVIGQSYQVTLQTEGGEMLYSNPNLLFDNRQLAQLAIPFNLLNEGNYFLIIDDIADTTQLGRDTLSFRIIF